MMTDLDTTKTVSETGTVFLCHSWDDKAAVRDLCQRLLDDGFHPWLDEREILPGQDWDHETLKALRNSDAVIVCLSRHSVTKPGYAQKEIKRALDLADEQPLGSIFLIPLRLEPCDVPDHLSKWQYVDYFEQAGYEKLKRALEIRHSSKAGANTSFERSSTTAHSPLRTVIPGGKSKPLPKIVPFGLISLVLLLTTIILGFVLAPDPATFPVTVYVHGPAGLHDVVLKNAGEVWMDLAGDRKRVQIGDAGQAYFPAIPASFRNQEVPVSVNSGQFESTQSKVKLNASSLYLAVHRKAGRLYGLVQSADRSCLAAAQVRVGELSAPVDPVSGSFELTVPGERLQDDLKLQAVSTGCVSEMYTVTPDSNQITVVMTIKQISNQPCSPNIVTHGNVTVNCSETDPRFKTRPSANK
ncbi:MAG TPA: toll/interleukin-1 receptor domain-containing protein [Candidatus Angelobacter sp.]|jgi:hypothetical protein|nr:toll/interleukin-1 receptor domain-containing protein [Candidatus Angelobacter sp.]